VHKPDAVLFDFDGTLVQITIDFRLMRARAEEVIRRYGLEPPAARYTLEMIAAARELASKQDAALAASLVRDAEAAIRAVELEAAPQAQPLPGVERALSWLHAEGVPIGIVTRNCRPAVLSILERLRLPYDALFTRDDVAHVKPNPEHLLACLRALSAAPTRSLMVGDHPTDMRAARAAGLVAVLVSDSHPAESAEELPDLHITRLDDLIGIVQEGRWEGFVRYQEEANR
jgi:phosphoglycolate phosphatase